MSEFEISLETILNRPRYTNQGRT